MASKKLVPITYEVKEMREIEFEFRGPQYGGKPDYDEIPDDCDNCRRSLHRCCWYKSLCYCGKDNFSCCKKFYYCDRCFESNL